jgi:hypothetical protein
MWVSVWTDGPTFVKGAGDLLTVVNRSEPPAKEMLEAGRWYCAYASGDIRLFLRPQSDRHMDKFSIRIQTPPAIPFSTMYHLIYADISR